MILSMYNFHVEIHGTGYRSEMTVKTRNSAVAKRPCVLRVIEIVARSFECTPLRMECRVGHESGPCRVGSGPLSKISNKYTINTQETDYSTTIIHNNKRL